ncbi:MAG: fatty oxidation complex subunit alpha [Zetaproteobacteria bacterium]|nr:MAG: fatty oxidation complex subunit alpha [Zetaproteobacteria bacterium]
MDVVSLVRENERARLVFSREDKPVNVLDEICLQQLESCLDQLEADPPKVLVLESAISGCFIAGADVDAIAAIRDAAQATRLAERGQGLCRRLEALTSVSIAVVRGACMGGGLELAMACDHLLAVEDKKTSLALPEIKLGIHPGFGGCVRLPKRVGWVRAVDMILAGRSVDAKRAARIGLADLTAPPERIGDAVDWLAARGKVQRGRAGPWWLYLPFVRWWFFYEVERKATSRFQHLDLEQAYPAIPATVKLLKEIVGLSDGVAYAREAESLGRLVTTPTCKNLVRVFHLGQSLKRQDAVKRGQASADNIRNTAVFGAGVMGSGIAWVAARTTDVDLHDITPEALERGMRSLGRLARRDAKRLRRIRPALDDSNLEGADVVIEAVIEELEAKQALWKEVEAKVSKDCLLLTNTSSLSVTAMQEEARVPARMAGLHFFNPAPKMPLVEVIVGGQSSGEVVDTVAALAVAWGKYPIVVRDCPGFLVNRCLMPYMVAALRLLESGQKPEHVDGALKHYGMPMGAIELADKVGLDICHHVGVHLSEAFGERFAMPAWFGELVKAGMLGEKSGKGFYHWSGGRRGELNPELHRFLKLPEPPEGDAAAAVHEVPAMSDQEICDACLVPMLVEALQCLDEELVESAVHVDAAMIFGIGFPPFRGGLLRDFAQWDREKLVACIQRLGLEVPGNIGVLDEFV